MAECIIARGGSVQQEQIPVTSDRCSVLITVRDSNKEIIPNLSVHCKDGDNWYNYHANEKGQVLFMVNSGAANVTAWNFSINQSFKFADQGPNTINIDCPAGQVVKRDIELGICSFLSGVGTTNNIYSSGMIYNGSYYFKHFNHVNAFIGAGGGGGGGNGIGCLNGGGGGAGGAIQRNNIMINKNTPYKFYIGSGGYGASGDSGQGSTGGSTSAFGYSVVGGTGGNFTSGGIHGNGDFNTGNGGYCVYPTKNIAGEDSEITNFGGGGGGIAVYAYSFNGKGGNPHGGYKRRSSSAGTVAAGAGGGGSASATNNKFTGVGSSGSGASPGGDGMLRVIFYN